MLLTLFYGLVKGLREIVKKKSLEKSTVMEVLFFYTLIGFVLLLPDIGEVSVMDAPPVAQSCPTVCNPMNPSTPGFPVHHQLRNLLQLMSTESGMPSNHLILCHPRLLLPSIFHSIRVIGRINIVEMCKLPPQKSTNSTQCL